jgi:hypothetical protein
MTGSLENILDAISVEDTVRSFSSSPGGPSVSLFYTSGRTGRGPTGGAGRPGLPRARSGRVGEIYRCGPRAEKPERTVFKRRAGALPAREGMGRAFGGSAAGRSTTCRFEEVYPSRASGRWICSAALGRKRKISLAHPPRVCPGRPRRENHGPATLRSVEQQGHSPPYEGTTRH